MQLPLRAVQEHSETLIADDEHVIVAVMHSSDCLVNADVLVTAVNERAAMQAEIERLRKALWRIITIVGFTPDGPHRGRDCAEIAHAALSVTGEPRP